MGRRDHGCPETEQIDNIQYKTSSFGECAAFERRSRLASTARAEDDPFALAERRRQVSEQNRENMRRVLEEAFDQGKVEVVDEVLHPDFRVLGPEQRKGRDQGSGHHIG